MKKKAIRVFTGLLCAALIFSNTAGMSGMCVYAMEDGAGQETQLQESVSGNDDDTGEAQEDTEESGPEPADGGTEPDTGIQDDPTEQGEGEQEEAGQEDGEAEEDTEEMPEDTEEEPEETETVSGNTVEEPVTEEENEDEGVMLLMALEEESAAVKNTDSTYTDENGVIYHYYGYDDGTAEIYELESCQESTWDYKALNIPSRVGDYTVTSLTFSLPSEAATFPSVTIPETVTYMKDSLFKRMKISELYYNAEAAETGAGGETTGVFFQAYIWGLHLGANVKVIPDYAFASAKITMDELTVDVERIGEKAFYYNKVITTLTIGENVKEIGGEAFAENDFENVNYNAINAVSAPYGNIVYGIFGYRTISSISIGDKVTVIPEHLFCSINYTADALIFPDSLTTIGEMAFYGDKISIWELTIGENITSIGAEAFARGEIGILRYNAVDALIPGVAGSGRYDNCFEGTEIGELQIGEQVRSLPDGLFCQSVLVQDSLTLPDSVTYIGAYVLSYSGGRTKIGTLEIGENVTHIGRAAFGANTFDKVIVRTVEADTPPRSDSDIELPLCSSVEIHKGSPYYTFFTKRTEKDNITSLCEDFLTNRGEEYYDAGKKSFVTIITKLCNDCGYGESRKEYSEACTVVFTDHDGRELSRQYIHKGEDATAPDEPERTGWRFTGWDKDFTGVTSDLTVKAVYQIRKYKVVFKDHDGSVISDLKLSYGADICAAKPADPEREPDADHTYQFTGWTPALTEGTTAAGVAEYTATYTSAEREYSIRFLDYDGSLLSELSLPYGADICAAKPADPKRAPDERRTYQFSGWEPALTEGTAVTGDAEYTVSYTSAERLYLLSFVDHTGSTIKTVTKPYGTKIADHAPKNPTREPDGAYTYTFAGWQPALTETDILTKDMEYQAVFTSDAVRCKVTFQNYDGSVLKEFSIAAGETVGDRAPAAARAGEGHSTYNFAGWQPALDKDAPVIGDITYRALYTRKTQTGVLAESGLNHPAGDGISAGDIRLYPVYEIYDTSDHFQERLTDREHPVDEADIRLSAGRIEKGSNRISAEQISTGFQTEFRIFGCYIDGITAELKDGELKTGSRLQELDVFFTKNRMGEDGQIRSGIADRTVKVRRYTFADGAAYVTIRKGDNAVRITEKETGENHSCTIHVTGVGEEPGKKPPTEKDEPDGDGGEDEKPSPSKKDIWKIALDIPQKKDTGRGISLSLDAGGEKQEEAKAGDPFTLILRQADKPEKVESLQEPAEPKEALAEKEELQEPAAEDGDQQAETGEPGKQEDEPPAVRAGFPLWIVPAALAVMGILALLAVLVKGRRRVFSGILTTEENPSIEVDAPEGADETVQEVIDRTENLEECLEELKGSGAKTSLPAAARMEISYRDAGGKETTIKKKADEKRMLCTLSRIKDCDTAEVRLFHDRYGIDIRLKFKL